ncbi:unnamed protein product [Anisakis simplex]|uniref:Synaptobrevin homolog YKT6 (inferred by orthology to a human protein) n=1 Tax=Anisakis simplex TaxID=6269 RepID=A0A0M3KEF9_ANISI|nr:unnamed protein product [Anisakis simplex]
MKVYSILVFHKDSSGRAKPLKSAFDLASFSFFQRSSVQVNFDIVLFVEIFPSVRTVDVNSFNVFKLQEFMTFTGKLLVERAALSSRNSVKENEYFCHRTDCGPPKPQKWSFQLTIKTEKDCTYTGLPALLAKWQNPREADAMTRVQEEVEETKIVLHNTIQSVLNRGEKLDDLVAASEGLSNQSKLFYTQARKMNKCCSWT